MSVVGRSLQNAKRANAKACRARYNTILQAQQDIALYGPKEEAEAKKLKSIWETSNMDAFLSIADDRENGYLAERNVRVVVGGAVHIVHRDKVIPQTDDRDWFKLSGDLLTIPKRPQWSFETKPAELERKEKIAFLEWRRTIASLEENHKVLLTPFEKNIEVWRQLWRVVERSDVLLEIVDARNPLAFRCVDFERYAASAINKMNKSKQVVMLINKADLLTENQRMAWAQYFEKRGEKFYFFSAKPLDKTVDHAKAELEDETIATKETNPIEKALQEEEEEEPQHRPLDDVDTDEDERIQKLVKAKKEKPRHTSRKLKGAPMQYLNPYELEAMRKAAKAAPRPIKAPEPLTREEIERNERVATKIAAHRPYDILLPEDLLDHMAFLRSSCGIVDDDTPLVVGMVGYPNVGKSSTINAIIGCKKVVVSATPGKTKHFQTLMIPNERRVMLCDCPGLVFPSFASTREQMVCDGVLPIDTVKDYVSPVAVICQRIPRQIFEHMYTVSLLQDDDIDESTCLADRLLNVIARRKGYMTDHDKPNRSKIAKEILKMYVDGVFVYVCPPPGLLLSLPEELEYELGLRQEDLAEEVTEKRAKKHALDADDEDEIWEDISSADDARALSEDGDESFDSADEELNAAPPMFFARPKGANLTQAELFNLETNYLLMPKPEKHVAKKRRTNHQLEPETLLVQNEDGEFELAIDSDDGIVEYDPKNLPRSIVKRDKQVSKRKQRREAKKMGLGAPVNPTARVVGFASTL